MNHHHQLLLAVYTCCKHNELVEASIVDNRCFWSELVVEYLDFAPPPEIHGLEAEDQVYRRLNRRTSQERELLTFPLGPKRLNHDDEWTTRREVLVG